MQENNITNKTISYVDSVIGSIGLVTIVIVTLGVFTRFVLKVSIAWSDELLRTVFVWSYFIGSAMQYRAEGLMSLDIFPLSLINRSKIMPYKIVKTIQDAVVLTFSLVIGYNVSLIIKSQIVNNQVTTTSGTPSWVLTAGVAIGMILIVIFTVRKIILTINVKTLG